MAYTFSVLRRFVAVGQGFWCDGCVWKWPIRRRGLILLPSSESKYVGYSES